MTTATVLGHRFFSPAWPAALARRLFATLVVESAPCMSCRLHASFILLACMAVAVDARADTKPSERGTPFDLQDFINRELQAGKQPIVVPPGRYRVTPHERPASPAQ